MSELGLSPATAGHLHPTLMGMQPLEATTLTVGWDWL